jgi:hypothetical protein
MFVPIGETVTVMTDPPRHDRSLPSAIPASRASGPRSGGADQNPARTADAMAAQTEILTAVTESLSAFVDHGDWQEAFGRLLRAALSLTYSEYGFVGVVVDGPVLRVLAHEGIVWDQVVNREFYEQALRDYWHHGYLTFDNFNNLFGRALTTGQVVIANTPDADPRA